MHGYSSPHSSMVTGSLGLSFPAEVGMFSIFRTTSSDSSSITLPNTTCLLSSQSHAPQVIKNWQPLVFGPELAMDSSPGEVWRSEKFSITQNHNTTIEIKIHTNKLPSAKLSPYILILPVPSELTISPM